MHRIRRGRSSIQGKVICITKKASYSNWDASDVIRKKTIQQRRRVRELVDFSDTRRLKARSLGEKELLQGEPLLPFQGRKKKKLRDYRGRRSS